MSTHNIQLGREIIDLKYHHSLLSWAMYLNPYPNDKFRFSQTERVCRRQFQIWRKWLKVLRMGRKRCGKRRNCSLCAISPFHTVFLKDSFCRHVKTRACLGKVLLIFILCSFHDLISDKIIVKTIHPVRQRTCFCFFMTLIRKTHKNLVERRKC